MRVGYGAGAHINACKRGAGKAEARREKSGAHVARQAPVGEPPPVVLAQQRGRRGRREGVAAATGVVVAPSLAAVLRGPASHRGVVEKVVRVDGKAAQGLGRGGGERGRGRARRGLRSKQAAVASENADAAAAGPRARLPAVVPWRQRKGVIDGSSVEFDSFGDGGERGAGSPDGPRWPRGRPSCGFRELLGKGQ